MPTTAEYLAAQPNVMQDMSQGNAYVNQLYNRSAQVQAGQQYATGNSPAAQSTLASSGDIAGAQQLHNDTVQNFQTQHAYVARAAPVLQAAYDKYSSNGTNPDAGKVAALFTFDQMAPELQQIGVPADNLLKIRTGLQTNTPETLQGIGAFAAVKPQFEKTGDTTGIIIDQNSGRVLAQVQGDKIVDAPPQNQVLRYGGDASGVAPPAAPQVAGAPVTPPGAPAPTQTQAGVLPSVNPAAVAQVESRGNPNAVSPAGATGTMQTMPGTLQSPGYGVAPAANNSPQEQTRVGQDYVAAMTQKYGPAIGLVAYNMGPGATDKWLAAGGDFANLPDETQKYIGRVAIQEAMSRRQPQPATGAPPAAQPQPPPQGNVAPGVQVLKSAQPEWSPASAADKATYPGAVAMNINGEPKYPPMAEAQSQLSPEAIKQGAAYFIQNGGKFAMGMRDKASVAATMNAVASVKPAGMSDNDWIRLIQNNGLALKARTTASGKAAGMQVATAINEGTVNNSINILKGLIPLAASTGQITDLNNFQQAVARHTNNAQAINFKNAIDSISAEYARVMTGSTSGAPSSDSARKEAGERILSGYNANTLPQVLSQMQAEMRGRSDSYKQALQEVTGGYGGISVPFSQPQGPQSNGPKVRTYNPATGKLE